MFDKTFFEKAFKIGKHFAHNESCGVGDASFEIGDDSISFVFSILMKDERGNFHEEKRPVAFTFDDFMASSIEEIFDRLHSAEKEIEDLFRLRMEMEEDDE